MLRVKLIQFNLIRENPAPLLMQVELLHTAPQNECGWPPQLVEKRLGGK